MTDEFSRLIESEQAPNLLGETEARWRLVETAWELGVSRAVVTVSHDPITEELFVVDPARRRRAITGARNALSGYQKGHCFYCFDGFSILGSVPPDVDPFFPHSLKAVGCGGLIDGVWNLVLACPRCNRGVDGKSDSVPSLKLLKRLHTRNEFLIASHHPLRETLMAQTGDSETERREFLNDFHTKALAVLLHQWEPEETGEPLF
jgi:5-methylcytosine-specific restriction endonuclease McrA